MYVCSFLFVLRKTGDFLSQKPLYGAHEARERYAASGRQPIPRQPLRGAHELRKRYAVSGLEFRRLRTAGTSRTRGGRTRGMDTYGFHPSCESPRFPLGYLGGDYIGEIQKGTVSVHVFRRDGHWPSHFAAGSRQIALVLRSDGLTSARAACLRRPIRFVDDMR